MTRTSTSDTKIQIMPELYGQQVAGWVTSTQTESDGVILYGPFWTSDEALAWAKNLINAVVYPYYSPSANRG